MMQSSNKSTPKSCTCEQCTYSKRTKPCQVYMKLEERAFRHSANQDLRSGKDEDILPAGSRSRLG